MKYSEDALVEQPAIALFSELEWETFNGFHEFDHGVSPLGREAKSEVVLAAQLRPALERLNPDLPPQAFEQAVEELVRDRSAMAPVQANREIYELLKNGVKVRIPDPNGGGETLRLAQAILEGLNHVEVRAAAANWAPLPGTDRIRSFRAYHKVFVIQKGENSEPPTQNLDGGNSHVANALAMIEREMARAPTAPGLTHLALMYSLMRQNQRAFQIVQQGLAAWPQDLRLLSLPAVLKWTAKLHHQE